MKPTFVRAGVACLLLGGALSGTSSAEISQCYPKIDNFVLFVDQSGSMYQRHGDSGEIKELMAKDTLRQLKATIPEVGYKGALYLFAPFDVVLESATYSRGVLKTNIERIPDSQPVAPRLTTMARGFNDLRPVVAGLSGKTAVIVFSDGGDNGGGDPIAAARELQAGHPDVCIHVVSFADSDHGREVNAQLAKLGQGCRLAEGAELAHDVAKREQFVRDVFCTEPPPKPKRRIVLRGVNFDFDKATIRPEAQSILAEAIRTLKEEPDIKVVVEGHTDAVGSDAYNQRLSERRATAVANDLAAGGVTRSRMSTAGFGESKPVASNETEDGRAQNRRVEFRVIEK